ncbi:hypothetical protein EDB85DRAFT_2254845 [Lactarius pseudohatsudake]|nr:hypothetical protein EDB85DRAFT_2254845 [Lactarius pseudohatsudake]
MVGDGSHRDRSCCMIMNRTLALLCLAPAHLLDQLAAAPNQVVRVKHEQYYPSPRLRTPPPKPPPTSVGHALSCPLLGMPYIQNLDEIGEEMSKKFGVTEVGGGVRSQGEGYRRRPTSEILPELVHTKGFRTRTGTAQGYGRVWAGSAGFTGIYISHPSIFQPKMPPSRTNKPLPELRAVSSRKRKETSRIIENADPLLPKNKKSKNSGKTKPACTDESTHMHPSPSTQKSSDTEEADNDGTSVTASLHPTETARTDEPADENDDSGDEAASIAVTLLVLSRIFSRFLPNDATQRVDPRTV